jgi:hypothetical protein
MTETGFRRGEMIAKPDSFFLKSGRLVSDICPQRVDSPILLHHVVNADIKERKPVTNHG